MVESARDVVVDCERVWGVLPQIVDKFVKLCGWMFDKDFCGWAICLMAKAREAPVDGKKAEPCMGVPYGGVALICPGLSGDDMGRRCVRQSP